MPLHALTVAVAGESHDHRLQSDRTLAPVPPVGLWVRGPARLDELADRSVAIVGSRASTAYGEHVAGELGHQLGERGWTVVSGGAFGIDAAAHRGALAAEAPTMAVLACGVDRPYPAAHGALFNRIAETGLLVSEWPPGCAPLRHRFLVRNRLIAALTRGTVVVEAAARSGAQATARRARMLGRELLVVPGPVTSAMSVGCHELLREREEGATLVTSAAQVIEAVGGIGVDLADPVERPTGPRDGLTDLAARVLDACPVRSGVSPERLAAIAGCDILDVLRVLPALELADLVQWTGTGWRLAPPPRKQGGEANLRLSEPRTTSGPSAWATPATRPPRPRRRPGRPSDAERHGAPPLLRPAAQAAGPPLGSHWAAPPHPRRCAPPGRPRLRRSGPTRSVRA